MKPLIKQLLREGLEESINLNLSKQLRSYQEHYELDKIFGKNVYRLYYDLDTGKQITPTRKKPKLKFDVNITDRLENSIGQLLANHEFDIIDFKKNIAKNNRNNQEIKISKILNTLDITLKNEYTTYLDSLKRQNEESGKLYAVVSRHSHDIASMSTKPRLSSCESLEGLTDMSQTKMGGMDSTDGWSGAEGGGQHIWDEIMFGTSIITYLIKEGDWNIEDPLGRILGTNLCSHYGNQPLVYGKYETKFKNFWVEWVGYYKTKILKDNDLEIEFDEDLFKKGVGDLIKTYYKIGSDETRILRYFLRGLINNNRFDVLSGIVKKTPESILDYLNEMFQPKVFKSFPSDTQELIKVYIDNELEKEIKKFKNTYLFVTNKEIRDRMLDWVKTYPNYNQFDSNTKFVSLGLEYPSEDYFEYENIAKAYNSEKLNHLNKMIITIIKNREVLEKISTS